MYWSYLLDSKFLNKPEHEIIYSNLKILTFESNNDLNQLIKGYCELIIDEYFINSFSNDYDSIFISEFCSTCEPIKKEMKFFIKFTDKEKAKNYISSEK